MSEGESGKARTGKLVQSIFVWRSTLTSCNRSRIKYLAKTVGTYLNNVLPKGRA